MIHGRSCSRSVCRHDFVGCFLGPGGFAPGETPISPALLIFFRIDWSLIFLKRQILNRMTGGGDEEVN